jgi:imidazolonepropionase-like amidohydrolase
VTTVPDNRARNRVGFMIREGIRRGYVPGPRMLACGRPITATGGHFHWCHETADGEEEIRRSVRRLVHEGADHIKIMASGGSTQGTFPGRPSYAAAERRAAAEEAHIPPFDRRPLPGPGVAESISFGDQLGTLTPVKLADLIVVEGDPARDITASSRVRAVFQSSQRVI